ncbi:MAG: hypothetical protein ACTSXQ_00230, partial [Alphaproteobacteria bacterium]
MTLFLNKILPSTGKYCLFTLDRNTGKRDDPKHYFFDTIEHLHARILHFNAFHKLEVFFALSSFKDENSRKQTNVHRIKSFWVDVDCGEGKEYPTKRAAIKSLQKAVTAIGLPEPLIVDSGNGLHVYWALEASVEKAHWGMYASYLKETLLREGLRLDPSRTTDAASVLRPVGTFNKKKEPKEVKVLLDAAPITFESFSSILNAYVSANRIEVEEPKSYEGNVAHPMLEGMRDEIPAQGKLIEERCAVINHVKAKAGDVPEPLWRSAIALASFCEEGASIATAWSCGHKDYVANPEGQEQLIASKIEAWREETKDNPPTCAQFDKECPNTCNKCPSYNKVTTPLQLGRKITNKIEIDTNQTEDSKESNREKLIKIGKAYALWYNQDKEAFATVDNKSYPLQSQSFKECLSNNFYKRYKKGVSDTVLTEAITTLSAMATYEGKEHQTFIRTGFLDQTFYLDLCHGDGSVIQITKDGWQVQREHSIKFLNPVGMKPLTLPDKEANPIDIFLLQKYLNVTEDDFKLCVGWLLNTLKADARSFLILNFNGVAGAGKSTASRLIRSIIDPHKADIRAFTKREDLYLAAKNGKILCYDNLSFINKDISDLLCQVATGGIISNRRLYTNDEENFFELSNPLILNGIPEIINRTDLLDRSIIIELLPINKGERLEESQLWEDFGVDLPKILGALL